jgi:hypothetical protein
MGIPIHADLSTPWQGRGSCHVRDRIRAQVSENKVEAALNAMAMN